ncbi:MAG TPA: DM13 domain-containing protein [Candidatus Acidoferrum sp.]|jgi:rhodanese-related sulfurtransferase|nr:DM13 domain-containing protein [Candidatus Acidoferrum sp.]
MMNKKTGSWFSRNKLIVSTIGVPVLAGVWWVFRPEKLFINQQVNEAAPAGFGAEPEALYTGKLQGKIHQTGGRATIYRTADGKQYLRLSDFATSNGPDVHLLLVRTEDKALEQEIVKGELDGVELGPLKGNQGDHNYDLPAVDLNKYQTVVVYCERFHAIFGVARLEKF